MSGQDIADLPAHLYRWMEGRRRLLKDQTDAAAANFPKLLRAGFEQIFSFERNGTFANRAVGWQKAQERRRESAFSRAGFAEHTENLSGTYIKLNASKRGADFARASGVRDVEVLDFKKGRHNLKPVAVSFPHYPWSA